MPAEPLSRRNKKKRTEENGIEEKRIEKREENETE